MHFHTHTDANRSRVKAKCCAERVNRLLMRVAIGLLCEDMYSCASIKCVFFLIKNLAYCRCTQRIPLVWIVAVINCASKVTEKGELLTYLYYLMEWCEFCRNLIQQCCSPIT